MTEQEASISTRTLVLGMVDQDGRLEAGPLFDVAAACGMTDQQVRLCLRRLVAEGALRTAGGRGRRAVFTAPDGVSSGALPEMEYLSLAYRQDAGVLPWDGRWHLVAFSVPESRRAARDEFRRRLRFLGGALAPGGTYVCANDWDADVRAEAVRLGIADGLTTSSSTDLSVGGLTDPSVLAARLWDLGGLGAEWAGFARTLAERRSATGGSGDRSRLAMLSVVEFAGIMERDPLLPVELLPPSWSGRSARAAMAGFAADADASDAPLAQAMRTLLARAAETVRTSTPVP